MITRPIHWRDLPLLYRYRNRSVFLDSALVLTRGSLLFPGALVSYVIPSMGITTYVCSTEEDHKKALFGQFIHQREAPFAQLTFLAPYHALASPGFALLLDTLMVRAGEQGIFRLLAHVDEKNHAFEALRHSSFAVYTRQRIWKFIGQDHEHPDETGKTGDQSKDPAEKPSREFRWRTARSGDAHSIRTLYNNVVPGLVQQVEPFSMTNSPKGMVYVQGNEVLAYVNLLYGPRGIWVQPFVHPDAQEVLHQFLSLIHQLPHRRSRPVYVCIRSYQSWLESALESLGARSGPRQAVMVKQLAVVQKVTHPVTRPVLEAGQPEITTSITRVDNNYQREFMYGTKENYR
jgi:hypothetical protein